ncbi:MAG: hypothetical protein ABMA01_23420 [Chthoniobacteraceae bacterium]
MPSSTRTSSRIDGGNPVTRHSACVALSNHQPMNWHYRVKEPDEKVRDPIHGEFFSTEAIKNSADARDFSRKSQPVQTDLPHYGMAF